MTPLNKSLIQELTEENGAVCVSLYMPLQREPDKAQENKIRLKNLKKEARSALQDAEQDGDDVDELIQKIEELEEDGRLPLNNDGLALFLADGVRKMYTVPQSFAEEVVVDSRFYIKPLLPSLMENGRFYILALSQNEVHLYEADRSTINEVTPDDLPQGVDDALEYEDPEKRQQFHTSTASPQARGQQPAAYHTHHPDEEKKSRIRRFFQELDSALDKHLGDQNVPLILAGVDYLHPLFKEATNYKYVLEAGIAGSPTTHSLQQLHDQGWPIAEGHFLTAQQTAVDRFNQLQGSEQISTEVTEIVPAARYGRVDTLFVAKEHQLWGDFDDETGQVRTNGNGNKKEELTNLAVHETLKNSGKVYVLPGESTFNNSPLAAILRY